VDSASDSVLTRLMDVESDGSGSAVMSVTLGSRSEGVDRRKLGRIL
jgi:hypothetical protein